MNCSTVVYLTLIFSSTLIYHAPKDNVDFLECFISPYTCILSIHLILVYYHSCMFFLSFIATSFLQSKHPAVTSWGRAFQSPPLPGSVAALIQTTLLCATQIISLSFNDLCKCQILKLTIIHVLFCTYTCTNTYS